MGHYMLFPDHRESKYHEWSNTNQKLCSTILLDDQRQVWQARRHFWQNAFRGKLLDWCVGNLCILVAQLVLGQPYTRVYARTNTHTHTHMMHMCTHVQTQYIHTNGCTYLSTSMKDILFSVQWDVGPCACHNLMLYAFCCIVGILLFFFLFSLFFF